MKIFMVILSVVFLYAAYPYTRIFIKRLILFCKLKRLCKNCGFTLIKNKLFWFLGRNGSREYDFFIETEEKVFKVKLFSVKYKVSFLFFRSDSIYYTERYIMPLPRVFIPITSLKKRFPQITGNFEKKEEWYIKSEIPVLLLNPVCTDVYLDKKILPLGENLYGLQFNSYRTFRRLLESEKTKYEEIGAYRNR